MELQILYQDKDQIIVEFGDISVRVHGFDDIVAVDVAHIEGGMQEGIEYEEDCLIHSKLFHQKYEDNPTPFTMK